MTFAQTLMGQFTPIQYLDFFVRILAACLCGCCIGLERSRRFKEAGIRTHIIVCWSAALMMILSKYAFADLAVGVLGATGTDPSRIASQVICGIGFLGAGVIFKHNGAVKGLTTAAGLWATAGIGMTIGSGMYILGLFATALMLGTQALMHRFPVGADSLLTCRLGFTLKPGDSFQQALDEFISAHKMQVSDMSLTYLDDGYLSCQMLVRLPREITIATLNEFLRQHGEVREVSCAMVV